MTIVRSIGSVVSGVLVWGVLWFGLGAALRAWRPDVFAEDMTTRDPLTLTVFLIGSVLLSVLAGYLCAVIAPRRAMVHVLVLAVIQLAIGIMVQASVWDAMPVWYHLPFLGLVVPAHLAGGWLRMKGRAAPRGVMVSAPLA